MFNGIFNQFLFFYHFLKKTTLARKSTFISLNFQKNSEQTCANCFLIRGQKKNYFWTVKTPSLKLINQTAKSRLLSGRNRLRLSVLIKKCASKLDRQKPTFIQTIRTVTQRRLWSQIETKRVVWVYLCGAYKL